MLGVVSSATGGFLALESLKSETSSKEFLLGGSGEVDCLHLFVSFEPYTISIVVPGGFVYPHCVSF